MSDVTRSDGLLPLRYTTTWPRLHVCVVHLAGDLDIATANWHTDDLDVLLGTLR